jgi:hypothetical protein
VIPIAAVCRREAVANTLALQATHSLPESLEALLKHDFALLQKSTLPYDVRGFGGHVRDLTVRHASDNDRREDLLRQRIDQVALNDLLRDSGDEILALVLVATISVNCSK